MINGCALTKSKIFLICCLAVILGVGAASFLPAKWLVYDLWLFGGVMFGLVIAIFFWKNIKFRLVGLVILFLFLGIWRYAIGMPADTPDKIWHYNGENFSFVGIVADEPDVRENSIKYKVESKKFKNSNASKNDFINVSGLVLVTADLYPTYKYGDELEVACQLRAPEEFSGFAYDKYLARYDIYSVCYYPQITKLDINQSDCLYAKIFKIKDKLRTAINRGLPEPSAGLARAIVLGDKRAINDDLRVVFSRAGISHIVAISGMHISFLAVIVMGLLLWLGLARKPAVWAASLILFIYLLLIGLPASAMRAGLMGFLVMFALSVGRLNRLTNALVLTAAILLLINPRLLRDDIGFQLSFLAVIGIAFVYPLISQWRYKINQPWMKRVFR
ncbi:MAG: ComEC family competence protein, partial [Patescibacteria group bacterium]|nr:ComEC family competence protein [Patescibacteria group bacterium]